MQEVIVSVLVVKRVITLVFVPSTVVSVMGQTVVVKIVVNVVVVTGGGLLFLFTRPKSIAKAEATKA